MKIIGIDPGINNLGWALVERGKNNNVQYICSGVIKTSSSYNISTRLYKIFKDLESIIELHKPELASIEEVFVNSNAQSSLTLAYARGSILALLGKYNLPVLEFAPNTIKKTIVGHGKAQKEQVMKMLSLVIPGAVFNSADEADAIAIAYTGAVYNNISRLN